MPLFGEAFRCETPPHCPPQQVRCFDNLCFFSVLQFQTATQFRLGIRIDALVRAPQNSCRLDAMLHACVGMVNRYLTGDNFQERLLSLLLAVALWNSIDILTRMETTVRTVCVNIVSWMAVAFLVGSVGHVVAADPQQQACKLERTVKVAMKYLLYLPKEYDQKPAWPMVLFLHGAGDRGDDLQLVKRGGLPKLIEAGGSFSFLVVSPQCPDHQFWNPFELTALLDEIEEKYKVDQDRVYVTGLSMGGFGAWALAASVPNPNRFAALVPICGGGDPFWTERIASIPTWVFHGAKDDIVPLERSKQMVDAMQKNGGNVKFTIYPDAGHDAWTETYANPQLYEWLLQQKRTPEKPEDVKK
jgi:poly(3-hydroxybutyrate) depolymerase